MNKRSRISIVIMSTLFILLAAGLALADWQGEAILGPPPIYTLEQPPAQPPAIGLDPQAYLPIALGPAPSAQPWVNTQSKTEVRNYYLNQYLASENVPAGWTGNHSSCNAGTTTAAFKQAMLTRINYFRAMAGIPALLGLKNEYNSKAQKAALMMSVNNQLSHSPPQNWTCYSTDGAQAAGSSNLYLGVYGPTAITGYVNDPGAGNYFVGHRRWVLYPQTQYMGTGDIPPSGGTHPPANALWVFDEHIGDSRPPTREEYVAWPPPGYTPYQVVFPRWSFAYALADLGNATVSMTKNGQPLSLQLQPVVYGYGERTLVWEPNDTFGQAPTNDIVYKVTVNNVIVNGVSRNFTYQVIIFKP